MNARTLTPMRPFANAPESQGIGLDGLAVRDLLQGAALAGHDPLEILEKVGIATDLYANPNVAIDGRTLVRLMRQIQKTLDDVYLGFMPQGCRLALEAERIICLMNSFNLGQALRVSIRFTNAVSRNVGASLWQTAPAGLKHSCVYETIDGVDRPTLVWIRYIWIYNFFSWLIGRPLRLRAIHISGPRPTQANGFDRFAVFQCPIIYDAPYDAIFYDEEDLRAPLLHRSASEYEDYYDQLPDWFANQMHYLSWAERTQNAIIDLQRQGWWYPSFEMTASRMDIQARRLRYNLALEGVNFQDLRTRLRGELAGAYLLATDLTIQDIGAELGFSEPGSFSRHFVSWAGTCPSSFRAEYGADTKKMADAVRLLNERGQIAELMGRRVVE